MNKKKKKSKFFVLKIVLMIILCLILAFALAVYGYFHSKFSQIQEDDSWKTTQDATQSLEGDNQNTEDDESESGESQPDEESDSASTESEGVYVETDEWTTLEPETVEITEPSGEMMESKKVFNILLIGTDERTEGYSTSRSDICMLVSLNTAREVPTISLVSFERDMAVPLLEGDYIGQYDKLNHTFQYGGPELLMKYLRVYFQVEIDYYVRVNFTVFEKCVDAVGGVEVYLDEQEAIYFRNGGIWDQAQVGINRLDGYRALCYARLREFDSDWVRVQRQREIIVSMLGKLKEMSLVEIDALIDTLLPMVRTNLTEWKLFELMFLLPSVVSAETQQLTIPQWGTYGEVIGRNGISMISVDFEANRQILWEFLYGE